MEVAACSGEQRRGPQQGTNTRGESVLLDLGSLFYSSATPFCLDCETQINICSEKDSY